VSNEFPNYGHHEAKINGTCLHFVEAGVGPLVVLLHGFPQFWYCWRHQISALAEAGFRVIAPDMRGYNLSDKPEGVAAYRMEELVEDVVSLVRHAGEKIAHVVGHDWGGVIAWTVAQRRPEVVNRLAVLNAPHPAAYRRELRSFDQLSRSWYVLFFQLPWLPERYLRAGHFARLGRMFRADPSRADTFTPQDVRRYKEALGQPGAVTAAVNYYRAALRYPQTREEMERPVSVPTLVIWGERDRYLSPRLLDGLEQWVPGVRVERLPGVSHWVQEESPEEVNRLLINFLLARP
jgi:pimeloyl-ACP methyl ester carboxylesterase